VGKILTKADVEQCRVVLPRMAMEANMPEVVDANLLHVVSRVVLRPLAMLLILPSMWNMQWMLVSCCAFAWTLFLH